MSKPYKKTTYVTIVIALLIILAASLRVMGQIIDVPNNVSLVTGHLRASIYIGLFLAWGFSLRYRIIQKQARRYLTTASILVVFWVIVRTLKYNYFSGTHFGRILWYSYYLPILFIPLLALFVALSLGKSEYFRLPKWSNALLGVSTLLLLFILTNDLHQLVFGFQNGLLHYDNNEYTHRICYYLAIGWMSSCAIAAFTVIAIKCRVPYSKRLIFLPCIPLLLLVLYGVLYLTAFDFIRFFAGDMTIVISLLTAITFEACIQCGLIQSNTHYALLFECTGIHSKIADKDYNILLSSAYAEPLSKEIMRQTAVAPVILDGGVRLCGAPIKAGYVMWSEDVSKITEVISELADNSEYLTARKSVLQREVETRREEQRLEEQNRLYNSLMSQNQEELILYSDLIQQLEDSNNLTQEKKLTAKLAVVCTHIKRRGNLLFLSERSEKINAAEVRFALGEWLSNLRLCDVKCNVYFAIKSPLLFNQICSLYDAFQGVILYALDTLHSLLVSADEKDGTPFLLLNLCCDRNLSEVSIPGVYVSNEGNSEWVVRISAHEGGAAV